MPEVFDASNHRDAEVEGDSSEKTEKDTARPKARRGVDDYSETMRREEPSHNPFDAYAPKPISTTFDQQHSSEKVILLLRQHPITQVKWMVVALISMLLPLLFDYVGIFDFLPPKYQFYGIIGWYLLIFGFAFESFLSWFYNVYIITDERVVDVDFHSLLYKNISSAKIDNIEDVTAQTGGALRSVFDYGTIKIQTAGEKTEFEFDNIPHPTRVSALLNELIVEEEREKIEGRVD